MAARRAKSPQGIYRRITVRMWGDAKVRGLSRPQPCGQVLWFHLLTGEQTDIIPGLCKVGEAAFAEQLGWPVEGFRHAFREVSQLGMVEADWDARVVWVPKAIEHNPPASVNVVLSWADAWDRIPECALKLQAWSTLRAFLEGMSKGFLEAYDRACPKPFDKASRIQDQDQDQEQEEDLPAPNRTRSADAPRRGRSPFAGPRPLPVTRYWHELLTPEQRRAFEQERHQVAPELDGAPLAATGYQRDGTFVELQAAKDLVERWRTGSQQRATGGAT